MNKFLSANPSMQPTEVIISENTYRIRKMDAFAGAALMKFMTSKGLPLLGALQNAFIPDRASDKKDEEPSDEDMTMLALQVIPPLLDAITDDELKSLMIRCLNYCDKKLDAGYQPVMEGENFGIEEAEGDVFLCLVLCFHTIAYNMKGFFSGSGLNLSQLTSAITSRLKPQTSMNTSLPQ